MARGARHRDAATVRRRVVTEVAVHSDDLASLAARAEARTLFPEVTLADPFAEELARELGISAARFDKGRLRMLARGEVLVDAIVRDFVCRHPAGLAVSVNPGICTRFSRIDNGHVHAIDFDTKELCAWKRSTFGARLRRLELDSESRLCASSGLPHGFRRTIDTSQRHVLATACGVGCTGFLRHLRDVASLPVMVVTGSALLRADPAVVDRFVTALVTRAPANTEWIAAHDVSAPMRPSKGSQGCLERLAPAGTSTRTGPHAPDTKDGPSCTGYGSLAGTSPPCSPPPRLAPTAGTPTTSTCSPRTRGLTRTRPRSARSHATQLPSRPIRLFRMSLRVSKNEQNCGDFHQVHQETVQWKLTCPSSSWPNDPSRARPLFAFAHRTKALVRPTIRRVRMCLSP